MVLLSSSDEGVDSMTSNIALVRVSDRVRVSKLISI